MATTDMAGFRDRITQTLADATREMTPLETFANVGRAAAQAATSNVTFGDAMNAQKAERIQAAKQMADFLSQQRQLELAENADKRAAEQLDISKDDALQRREEFSYRKSHDAEDLALRKDEAARSDQRLGIDRERLGLDRQRMGMEEEGLSLRREDMVLKRLQFAADRQDADAAAVLDALQTLIPEEERAIYAAKLEELPYDVNRYNATATIGRIRRQIEAEGGIPDPEADIEDTRKLRNDFTKLSEDFISVRDSYATMDALAEQLDKDANYVNPDNAAPGDLSFIFAYMKMLDPVSSVREGEQATAENARGVGSGIRNIYNSILTGAKLTPAQRRGFLNQAASLYKARQGNFDARATDYRRIAEKNKMDPADVVLDFAGPYRYRVMSNDELTQAIDAADSKAVLDAIAEEQKRRGIWNEQN